MDQTKCASALMGFIQKMSSLGLNHFDELSYGTHLYDSLGKVAPSAFTDASTKMQGEGLDSNWVLRKANLLALAADMTAYARSALSAPEDFDVVRLVDITAAAKVPSSSHDNATASAAADEPGVASLRTLVEVTFVMCIMSGNQDAISMIRTLTKEDQTVLNQIAKRVMGLYGLKPAKKGGSGGASAAASGAATPTAASPSGRLPSIGSHGDASSVMSGGDTTTTTGLQQQVQQLRGELRDRQAQVHELEARVELAERERKDVQERYRSLLESTEEERGATQADKSLSQQLSKKDDHIRELSTAIQDLTGKNTALKNRMEVLEDALEAQQKASQQATVLLKQRTEEKQEAQTQLDILRDRYEVTMGAKKDLNEELSSLRNEVEVLRAKDALRSTTIGDAHHRHVRDEDGTGALDENEELRERLNAALAELRVLRHPVDATTPHRRQGIIENDDGASPEASAAARIILSGNDDPTLDATVSTSNNSVNIAAPSTGVPEEEYRRVSAELSATKTSLNARDQRINELEKKAVSLEGHLQRSLQEIEDMKLAATAHPPSTCTDDASSAVKLEADKLRKQNGELLQRLDDRSEASKKEQAILVSTVVQYGHKNLLLQQSQLLGSGGGDAASSNQRQGGGGGLATSVMQGWFLNTPVKDTTEIHGSFLTKQRRTVERGLLDRFLVPSSSSAAHKAHK